MEISVNQNNNSQLTDKIVTQQEKPMKKQQKEEALLDFSSMFKKNGYAKRPMPKLGAERKAQTQANWLLQIPAKLQITTSHLEQRRFMNQQKWMTMTKTSSLQDSPLAAALSSINYLLKKNCSQNFIQIKLNEIKQKLEKSDTFTKQLTRIQIILQCIKLIKEDKKLSLDVKVHQLTEQGKNRQFLEHIIQGLKSNKKAFVYVCYGHVFCPIGFDNTPLVPLDAYKKLNQIDSQKMELWFILASSLKSQAPFLTKRWTDIEKEMTSRWPQYLDLQQAKKGVQTWDNNQQNSVSKIQQISCWIQLTLTQSNS